MINYFHFGDNLDLNLDIVYDEIDQLLTNNKFVECDTILKNWNCNESLIDITLALLVTTISAKALLPSRDILLSQFKDYLKDTQEKDSAGILYGL